MSKVKAIIPCAGFGTRMGMNSHESKEMLDDPVTGKKVIDYSLDLCEKYDLDPIVVTRAQKMDLITHLNNRKVEVQIYEPEGEWAKSVLATFGNWNDKNILLLPDTRFSPESALGEIRLKLFNHDLVFGIHRPEVKTPWGVVEHSDGTIWTAEKPSRDITAWGIIGFSKVEGTQLFTHYMTSNDFAQFKGATVSLDKFVDITRSGRLEKY